MRPPLLDIMILIGCPKEKEIPWGVKGEIFLGGGRGEGGGSEGEEYKEYTILCILYSPFFLSYLK